MGDLLEPSRPPGDEDMRDSCGGPSIGGVASGEGNEEDESVGTYNGRTPVYAVDEKGEGGTFQVEEESLESTGEGERRIVCMYGCGGEMYSENCMSRNAFLGMSLECYLSDIRDVGREIGDGHCRRCKYFIGRNRSAVLWHVSCVLDR